jgi:hypothetical protein
MPQPNGQPYINTAWRMAQAPTAHDAFMSSELLTGKSIG